MKSFFTLLSVILVGTSLTNTVSAITFEDVPNNHPHYFSIETINEAGIINGYPDGTFKPNNSINRVEFLKILIEAKADYTPANDESDFDIYSLQKVGFKDVEAQQWYIPYLRYAKQQGIIAGYPDGTFKPSNTINLAEALKIIFTTFDIPTVQFIQAPDQWYEYYTGALESDFSSRTKLNVDSQIDKALTRAEAASLIEYFMGKVEESEVAMMEKVLPALKYEPLLLEGEFRPREQEHLITGYVTYPSSCGKPKPNVIIDKDASPQQVKLEILEANPLADLSKCIKTETEHEVVFRFNAEYDAEVIEVMAYDQQVSFIIHNTLKEINHPLSPLVLYLKGNPIDGLIKTEGLIYGNSSCEKVEASVLTYPGETTITQVELNTKAEGQSCVPGQVELTFEIDIPENSIIRGRINEQPVSITFEEESLDAFRERSRTRR